ncbi:MULTISPECIES: hypothetical protein [unclassified Streptomyces]|uniref:hypothetical protein n=1 Tax=unclassified Streptomyces TaxID=2593676 RepID=UPI00340DD17D
MPGYDSLLQNVPYPKLSDAPNIETAMAALVAALVPLNNMRFADTNARNAAIPSPVAGMETYLVAEARKELFDGTAWVPLTPGPWVPLTFKTGYTANSGNPGFRIVGDMVQLRGIIQKVGGGQMVTSPANGWLDVATLPISARPAVTKDMPIAVEWQSNNQTARLSVATDGTLRIGILTNLSAWPTWASLDGVQFASGS